MFIKLVYSALFAVVVAATALLTNADPALAAGATPNLAPIEDAAETLPATIVKIRRGGRGGGGARRGGARRPAGASRGRGRAPVSRNRGRSRPPAARHTKRHRPQGAGRSGRAPATRKGARNRPPAAKRKGKNRRPASRRHGRPHRKWDRRWRARNYRGRPYYWRPGIGWYVVGVGAVTAAALRASAYYYDGCTPQSVRSCQTCWPNDATGEFVCTATATCRTVWVCR